MLFLPRKREYGVAGGTGGMSSSPVPVVQRARPSQEQLQFNFAHRDLWGPGELQIHEPPSFSSTFELLSPMEEKQLGLLHELSKTL